MKKRKKGKKGIYNKIIFTMWKLYWYEPKLKSLRYPPIVKMLENMSYHVPNHDQPLC